jgi:hypothetical protein
MSTEPNDFIPSFDPGQRRLCPDGACVGVIGDDGKCKICGAVDPDGPPVADTSTVAPAAAAEPEPMETIASPEPRAEGGFDPNRRLCADDTCIGVLDEQGRCKVCGRSA